MAWTNTETVEVVNNYLKLPTPEQVGGKTQTRIRVLDQEPVKIFRHWIGPDQKSQRPFNCPGARSGCPACAERATLKNRGDAEAAKELHRFEVKHIVNVLALGAEPKTKILSFGKKLEDQLNDIHDEYGDLREYDVTIIKRKTGPLTMNIEYGATYGGVSKDEEGKLMGKQRKLTDLEKSAAEERFDLQAEAKPASIDEIRAAIAGKMPEETGYATMEQIQELDQLITNKEFTYEDLGVSDPQKMTEAKALELIANLR